MNRRSLVILVIAVGLAAVVGLFWDRMSLVQENHRGTARLEPSSATSIGSSGAPSILYYRNPMGLPDTSPVPKKDAMGMDYVPVFAGEESKDGQVRISGEKLQKLGVKTETSVMRPLSRTLRVVGTFQADERRESTVSAKFEGYITRVLVNTTGASVVKGQPLLEVYGPDLVSAQQDYRVAVAARAALAGADAGARASADGLVQSSLERLRNWDIADADLAALRQGAAPRKTIVLRSQHDGVVIDKPARAGMRFMPGDPLYQIADLSTIWLVASVYEQDLGLVHLGQAASVSTVAYPGRSLAGTITFISPVLQADTRTAAVRIELPNPGRLLKPAMYGQVDISAGSPEPRLAVPDSAILDTGTRKLVIVDRGGGAFEPREVQAGVSGDGYTEILAGLLQHEAVVVNGNFLIDAESNLKAAVGAMAEHAHGPAIPKGASGTAPVHEHAPTEP